MNSHAIRTSEQQEPRAPRITPAVDILETGDALTLLADLPGVAKDDLHLAMEGGVLTLEAPAATAGEGVLYREFAAATYFRRFQLPDDLDLEGITATLRDGLLTLILPKTAAVQPRRIEVTVH